jgi:hypothetical protein
MMRSLLLMLAALMCYSSHNTHCFALQHKQESMQSHDPSTSRDLSSSIVTEINRGGGWIPAGYNPFGYQITELGETFLKFEGSLDSDVGRFLASCKSRKTLATIKAQWLEILRASKKGQSMRIYRSLDDLIKFCLDARLLD